MNPCRPPRQQESFLSVLSCCVLWFSVLLVLQSCVPSSVHREASLRSLIRQNLFSTEHLAFGADPRSVSAVKGSTTADDIPGLIALLADSSSAVASIAQHVIVSYDQLSVPILQKTISEGSRLASRAEQTLGMIRKRQTNTSN